MCWYIFYLQLGWHSAAVTHYTFTHKLYVDMLIHLLTAVGLTTSVSNAVHIYTQTLCWCVDIFFTCSWFDILRQYHSTYIHTLYVDVVIHLLTAFGLTTYGCNTVNIYTQALCWYVKNLLTSVVLTPCGSNSVHIYTQTLCWCVYTFVICSWVGTVRQKPST